MPGVNRNNWKEIMTYSNDDCSVHLLSDVKEGTLVQVIKSTVFEKRLNKEAHLDYLIDKGELMIFMGTECIPPQEREHCWSYIFEFLHAEHGLIYLYWDMNFDFNWDLASFLKIIPTRDPKQLELFNASS